MSADPLVQFFITNNSLNSAADGASPPIPNTSERTRYHYLNHPSTAGNYLWIAFRVSDLGQDGSGNPTITVKDDTGTSWTQDPNSPVDETTNGSKLCFFSRANCPAGVHRIEVDATAQISFASAAGGEFAHVSAASPRDSSNTDKIAFNAATYSSNTVTTTTTDIVLHVASGQGVTAFTGLFGMNPGYTCLGADMISTMVAQYAWDVAPGAQNPFVTVNGGGSDPNGYTSFTIGLTMDLAQGSLPSKATPRVVRALWGNIQWSTIGNAATSCKMQVPSRGRLLISGTQIPAGSSMSDAVNGAWTATSDISQVGSGDVKFDYKLNPAVSPTGALLTISGIESATDPQATVCILDVECDLPLAYDATAGVPLLTGTQNTTTTLAPVSITPSVAGGFAMFNIAINTGTGQDTTTTGCNPLHPWSPQYNGGENAVAEDDIWAFMIPSSTATLTPGFTCLDQGAGVKQWSAAAISFIPASAALTGTVTPSIVPADVVAGGKTIITTLVGDTLVAASALATLQYVGTASSSGTGATYTCALTGLTGGIDTAARTNDLVICATGWTASAVASPSISTTGYTAAAAKVSGSDTRCANLFVGYKFMSGTPDTTVTVNGPNSATNGGSTVVHVWRNVDQTTPMDVTAVTTSGINGSRPNPITITPVTAGAVVVEAGGGTGTTSQTAFTVSAGYGNSKTVVGVGSGNGFSLAVASKLWSGSGAEDPAAFTGGTTSTSDSWGAYTIVLRPATLTPFNDARQAIINGIVATASPAHGWNNAVTPAIPVANVVRTSSTVITITLPAVASYTIPSTEAMKQTVPATATASGAAIVAAPTFQVIGPPKQGAVLVLRAVQRAATW